MIVTMQPTKSAPVVIVVVRRGDWIKQHSRWSSSEALPQTKTEKNKERVQSALEVGLMVPLDHSMAA